MSFPGSIMSSHVLLREGKHRGSKGRSGEKLYSSSSTSSKKGSKFKTRSGENLNNDKKRWISRSERPRRSFFSCWNGVNVNVFNRSSLGRSSNTRRMNNSQSASSSKSGQAVRIEKKLSVFPRGSQNSRLIVKSVSE